MNVSRALVILALFCPSATAQKPAEAVFSFGVVADVQYADQPDSGKRHYKSSLGRLEKCVSDLNRRDLSFVVQLGDFIDKGKENYTKWAMPKLCREGDHHTLEDILKEDFENTGPDFAYKVGEVLNPQK